MYRYLIFFLPFIVSAGGWQHKHEVDVTVNQEPQDINIVIEQEPVQVDLTGLTGLSAVDQTNYTTGYNECQGVAIAMAAANNTMYAGTDKLQVSGGMGTCEGEWAGSLMGGMKVRNNMFINGNWAFDEKVNAFGFGATWVFK